MQLELRDLKLPLRGTWLSECLQELHGEMKEQGAHDPPARLAVQRMVQPETTRRASRFPFYLAHPRLMRLERKMIIDVEGGTRARMHAHPAPRGRSRDAARLRAAPPPPLAATVRPFVDALSAAIIGPTRRAGITSSICGCGTRRAIPDEDFAETFAVWLTPRSNWRKRYEGWPALKKLEYVDELMAEIARQKPKLTRRTEVDPLRKLRTTLAEHYQQEAAALLGRCAAHLRPRSAAHLLEQSAAPAFAAGGGLHPAPPRRLPAAGVEMDRRIPAHARSGARRDDRALPRVEIACGRARTAVAHGFHGAVDRQDGAFALQPAAAAVVRAMKKLRVLVLTASRSGAAGHRSRAMTEQEIHALKTEYDVVSTLRGSGHEVMRARRQRRAARRSATRSKASSRTSCSTCSRSFTARRSTTRTS